MFLTVLSSVGATNDRWNTAGRSRQRKRVCKALRGSANGGSCRAGDAAANLEEAGGRDGRGAGDHEAVEVQSQLKFQTKINLLELLSRFIFCVPIMQVLMKTTLTKQCFFSTYIL